MIKQFQDNIEKLILLKQLEKKQDVVKTSIQQELNKININQTRFVFGNMVAKYMRKGKYEVNQDGLKDLMNDLGLFSKTIELNTKLMNKEDLKMIEKNFLINKEDLIRVQVKNVEEIEYDFSNLNIKELLKLWFENEAKIDELNRLMKQLKWYAKKDKELMATRKISNDDLTISLVKQKKEYDIQGIVDTYGYDFVKVHSNIVLGKIDQYMEQGFVSEKEIKEYKRLIDINVSLVLTTLENEEMMFKFLNDKRLNASLNKEAV